MAKFELNYNHTVSYEEKVVLEVKLSKRPSKEDYQELLDAIKTIDLIKTKYIAEAVPKEEDK